MSRVESSRERWLEARQDGNWEGMLGLGMPDFISEDQTELSLTLLRIFDVAVAPNLYGDIIS